MHLFSELLIQYYSFIYNPYNESSITEEFINFYVLWINLVINLQLWWTYVKVILYESQFLKLQSHREREREREREIPSWYELYIINHSVWYKGFFFFFFFFWDFIWKGQRSTFLLASLSNSNKIPWM